jgi:ADP-heptose:LPS heptosyltransferase
MPDLLDKDGFHIPDGPRILFITSNRLGDAVLSSGVLAHLVQTHPTARFTVACGALSASLFADLPGLERVHVMVKRPYAGHWFDLWKSCVGRYWDTVADLRGSALAWSLLARKRMVCSKDRRHEHRVVEIGRLLRLPAPPDPILWVSGARDRRAAALLADDTPLLAVGPTANWGAKQWPADRFAETVRRLTAADGILPGARVAVLGAADERDAARPVLDAIPPERRLDLFGMADLLDVYALLRRCAFYLGNDSGLMHLAAAAGIPTLGLFGPSPEWRYAPWGPRAAVVRTPESYGDLVLENFAFDYRSQATMMGTLTVEAVVTAARALWARAGVFSAGNGACR